MNKIFADQETHDLKINKLIKSEAYEVLSISLKSGKLFPEHISRKDAHLLVLKGRIQLNIADDSHYLVPQDVVAIPKDEKHDVRAIEDSNFLIIR